MSFRSSIALSSNPLTITGAAICASDEPHPDLLACAGLLANGLDFVDAADSLNFLKQEYFGTSCCTTYKKGDQIEKRNNIAE
jgi:hypothetical protein